MIRSPQIPLRCLGIEKLQVSWVPQPEIPPTRVYCGPSGKFQGECRCGAMLWENDGRKDTWLCSECSKLYP